MALAGKFGDKGTITAGPDRGAVVLDLSQGDFVTYKVTARGANDDFAFSVGSTVIRRVNGPQNSVDWTVRAHDLPTSDDMAGIQFFFATGALSYKLTVTHVDKKGDPILVLKDFTLATTEPSDVYIDTLRVFVV